MKGREHFDRRMRQTPGLGPEHLAIYDQAYAFGATAAVVETNAGARDLVEKLGAAGLLKPITGRFSLRGACVLRETLAFHHGLLDFAAAMQGLGSCALAVTQSHADSLANIAAGRAVAAFALTEPNAGSDLAAIETTASPGADGWQLAGRKHLISNAPIADAITVLARTDPGAGPKGMTMFLVKRGEFSCPKEQDIVAFHPLGELTFGATIPADRVVGKLGEGYKLALTVLDLFRTTVAAAACGMAGRALAEALDHVQARVQFGKPLADLPQVRAHLADMAAELEGARLAVYRSAAVKDAGAERIPFESATAKLLATESAQRIIDTAVQLHGGLGVLRGTPVERLYREVRALRIYEGATDILKLVIAGTLLG
jgi:acyl-CoA dehydrogenase